MKKTFFFLVLLAALLYIFKINHINIYTKKKQHISIEQCILPDTTAIYHIKSSKDLILLQALDQTCYKNITNYCKPHFFSGINFPITISLHIEKKQYHYVMYVDNQNEKNIYWNTKQYIVEKNIQTGNTHYTKIIHKTTQQHLIYCFYKGYYIISSSEILLKKVLNYVQKSVQPKINILSPQATKNASLQIIFNYISTLPYTSYPQYASTLARHSYLQLFNIIPNISVYSGFTTAEEKHFLYTFHNQKAQHCTLFPYIIPQTALCIHYTFSDAIQWWQSIKKNSPKALLPEGILHEQQQEIACITFNQNQNIMLWKIKNKNKLLKAMQETHFLWPKEVKTDLNHTIYPLHTKKNILWKPNNPHFIPQYCMFIDDKHIVFAMKQEILTQYLQYYLVEKMNTTFQAQQKYPPYILPKANMNIYVYPKAFSTKNRKNISSCEEIILQWNFYEQKKWYTNLVLNTEKKIPKKETIKKIQIQKNTKLVKKKLYQGKDDLVIFPQMLKSHYNKKIEYFFMQDKNYVLYFLDEQGNLLWKKSLYDDIISPFFTIDFHKNGKIQYLFATKKKVYILDYYGNSIKNYPLFLPQNAPISAINLIDYDSNKQYRIAITTKNKIYLYNQHQKLLQGWHPKKSKKKYQIPLKHIRQSTKDYLLTLQEDGCLQIMNRKGHTLHTYYNSLKSTLCFCREKIFSINAQGILTQLNMQAQIQKKIKFYKPDALSTFTLMQDACTQQVYILRKSQKKVAWLNTEGKVIVDIDIHHKKNIYQVYDKYFIVIDIATKSAKIYDKKGKCLTKKIIDTDKKMIVKKLKHNKLVCYVVNNNVLQKYVLGI